MHVLADITLQDPLGRQIVLHDHTWYGHIIKRHGDMRGLRDLVAEAIRAPLEICYSASDPDCRLYFGRATTPGIMVVVVADVVRGFIRTAYRTARRKGVVEWSPPTP